MGLTNMIISAIIKKGILYEARNCDIECDIPMSDVEKGSNDKIVVRLKIDHMTLRLENSKEKEA